MSIGGEEYVEALAAAQKELERVGDVVAEAARVWKEAKAEFCAVWDYVGALRVLVRGGKLDGEGDV